MTEAEWLACETPVPMCAWVKKRGMDRKFRLLSIACTRRFWHVLDAQQRGIAEAIEASAEEVWTTQWQKAQEVAQAEWMRGQSWPSTPEARERMLLWASLNCSSQVATYGQYLTSATEYLCIVAGYRKNDDALFERGKQEEARHQANLAREVFGNPFSNSVIEPSTLAWRHGTIPKIAQSMYTDGSFTDMPILADALEEAGCTDAAILQHCREPREHVRGCWVLDLLLGKT